MLADNKFTASCSVTSSKLDLFDKFVLVLLEIFVRLLEEATFLSQCHMVGGVSDVRTCNHCHIIYMPVVKQCFYRVMWLSLPHGLTEVGVVVIRGARRAFQLQVLVPISRQNFGDF